MTGEELLTGTLVNTGVNQVIYSTGSFNAGTIFGMFKALLMPFVPLLLWLLGIVVVVLLLLLLMNRISKKIIKNWKNKLKDELYKEREEEYKLYEEEYRKQNNLSPIIEENEEN